MISVAEALRAVLEAVPSCGSEVVPLGQCGGRVLRESIRSPRDVPPFPNAAMDGYAVRSADLAGAGPERPVTLRVVETVGAGRVPRSRVEPGTAIRIMTGAVVPEGADAVVRVEDTSADGDEVLVRASPEPGACVRLPGEDVARGAVVFEAGRVLAPADVGVLASLGVARVRVAARPRVAIVSTGDELVEVDEELAPGKIVNSNAWALSAAVAEAGGDPVRLGIVRDDPAAMREVFGRALEHDVVLSTGGVSVGSFDYVRQLLGELGVQERFWRVAQRPGKPLSFGLRGKVPVFGLPGNPVSALVCFYVYVLPALRRMLGRPDVHLPIVRGQAAERIRKAAGLVEFVRCIIEHHPEGVRVRSAGPQSSGVLRTMALGQGLIIGSADRTEIAPGETVRVLRYSFETGGTEAPA